MKYVIIGLSNVGKSSIFNYLIGESSSIVWNEQDTTVDYLSYNFENNTLTDTCGLKSIESLITMFSEKYYQACDVVLYVIDSRKNNFNLDRVLINKIIANKTVWLIYNFFFDGLEVNLPCHDSFFISQNFNGAIELKNKLQFKKNNENDTLVVLVGVSNVGKSTLFNSIVGSNRSMVKNEIGTTRDSIKEKVNSFTFVDTAGFINSNDIFSLFIDSVRQKMIEKACCLVFVIDGSVHISKLDKYVLNLANQYGIFSILVVNKSDKMDENFKYEIERLNNNLPIVYTSAIQNKTKDLLLLIDKMHQKTFKNYQRPSYINSLNDIIKKLTVCDIKNKPFKLQVLKFICSNPLTFLYESYFPLSLNSQKMIIKIIQKVWRVSGFRVVLQHKK